MKKILDNIVLGIAAIAIIIYVTIILISFSTNDPKKQFISEPLENIQKENLNE